MTFTRVEEAEAQLNSFGYKMRPQWSSLRIKVPFNQENVPFTQLGEISDAADQTFIRYQFLSNFVLQPEKTLQDEEEEARSKGCFQEKIDRYQSLAVRYVLLS